VARGLHTLYGTADTAWVGRLGPEAIAAVSTSFFLSWTLFAVGDILIAGVTALVSQGVGARRDDEGARAAHTGVVLAVVLGVIVAVGGWFGSPRLFEALFDDPAIARMGGEYLSLISLLAPALYLSMVAEATFRACGDSRTPMKVVLLGTLLNVVLDPFLILGIGPFPRLEVRGAAIATIISEVVVTLAFAALYLRRRFPLALRLSDPRMFSSRRAGQIMRIGIPHALIGILFSAVYVFLARITGAFGAPALAALGVVNRLESLNYLTSSAVGLGVATMVGQNLGAGLPERAQASANRGALLVTWSAGVLTVAFLFFAEPLMRVFTSDATAVAEGAAFLRIVAISQVFMGWELVYSQAFTGAGDTLPPLWVSSLTSVVRVPLAWWLAGPGGAGPAGIWWTISITGIVRGIVIPLWFRLGRWREKSLGMTAPSIMPAPLGPDSADG
jgi:putative MATE family efflux protein